MHESYIRIDVKDFPLFLYQLSFPTLLPVHFMADKCSRTLLLYVLLLIFVSFMCEASPGLE